MNKMSNSENKENNNLLNLEWCDARYNNYYSDTFRKLQKKVQCIESQEIYESMNK